MNRAGSGLLAFGVLLVGVASAAPLQTPAELYGELFEKVQTTRVFADSKTFVDAVPVRAPAVIRAEYERDSTRPGFDLPIFVASRFKTFEPQPTTYRTEPGVDVRVHIDRLWSVLERQPADQLPFSSRLPLPYRFIVPGGRFNEIYYWDSYFTMLGLEVSGRHDLTQAMVKNFAYLIDEYGHIPNGNRSYFLSRSQPPFFAAMIELLAQKDGDAAYREFLPQLRREHAFWMDGEAGLAQRAAHRRVVRLRDGTVLNRYWDDRETPREESYREDVATAAAAKRPASDVYRNLRAAAESGWDFSSRWLADGKTLATIRTTELVPVDLNSLLYQLEMTIAHGCGIVRDEMCVKDMNTRATARKAAIATYLWSAKRRAFVDYDWKAGRKNSQVTAATLYPLYFGVSSDAQATQVAGTVRTTLLQPHGLATTVIETGEQWDKPNGWAPLQWIAIRGLRNYAQDELAGAIAERWVATNMDVFRSSGKLVEKYDVSGAAGGHGGEYPLQDGFGWTNGVLRRLLADYPALAK